jgi:hypothetical protein
MWVLAACFLAVSVPVETVYSWRNGLSDPYYLVKVAGWVLLMKGVIDARRRHAHAAVAFLVAGWAWLAANFWRALADRVTDMTAGQSLRLGSIELWFAGGCLLVCLVGLMWSLRVAARQQRR